MFTGLRVAISHAYIHQNTKSYTLNMYNFYSSILSPLRWGKETVGYSQFLTEGARHAVLSPTWGTSWVGRKAEGEGETWTRVFIGVSVGGAREAG